MLEAVISLAPGQIHFGRKILSTQQLENDFGN